ncbi:hypothetical protein ACFQVC_34335 [Streptomyces monticola]|uniref:Uncharacterized protein n=1 Tax=Streptomyces monticola TaxID=2666263 RepID=A0ABW2JUL5_9ACTN
MPFAADGAGGVLYLNAGESTDSRVHAHDKEGSPTGITTDPMWASLTALMHYTAEALRTGEAVDGYLPPNDATDLREWRDAEAPEPTVQRYGKFGVPIDD